MPPLARTIGVMLWLAACPAWLAAQTPSPSGGSDFGRSAPSSALPKLDCNWPNAPKQGQAAAGGVVRASFEQPAEPAPGPSRSDAEALAGSLGVRPPAGAGQQPVALRPRTASDLPSLSPKGRSRPEGVMPKASGLSSLVTTASSLAVVLGLFFVFAWAMRRAGPRGSTMLPAEVLEVLGRAPLAARQQVYLIRCGQKLVLVHACPESVETLTEITEPEEVERLLGLCRQTQPNSATTAFRQVFQQFAGERTSPGFLGENAYDDVRLANAGISRPSHGRLEDDDV